MSINRTIRSCRLLSAPAPRPSSHRLRTWWHDSILNPSDVATRPSAGRSPSLTAFLSFLWPGLGEWYAGSAQRALLFAIPVLTVAIVFVLQLQGGAADRCSTAFSQSPRSAAPS